MTATSVAADNHALIVGAFAAVVAVWTSVLIAVAVSDLRQKLRRRPTPPPLALVASPEPAPTQVIPVITSAAWPRGRSADDTLVTHRVLPEDVTLQLPRVGGPRWS